MKEQIEILSGSKYLVRDKHGYISAMIVEMVTNTTYLIRWKGKDESVYLEKAKFGTYGEYEIIEMI